MPKVFCFKGSRTSCDVISFGVLGGSFFARNERITCWMLPAEFGGAPHGSVAAMLWRWYTGPLGEGKGPLSAGCTRRGAFSTYHEVEVIVVVAAVVVIVVVLIVIVVVIVIVIAVIVVIVVVVIVIVVDVVVCCWLLIVGHLLFVVCCFLFLAVVVVVVVVVDPHLQCEIFSAMLFKGFIKVPLPNQTPGLSHVFISGLKVVSLMLFG